MRKKQTPSIQPITRGLIASIQEAGSSTWRESCPRRNHGGIGNDAPLRPCESRGGRKGGTNGSWCKIKHELMMRASFTLQLSALSAGDEVCNPLMQRYPVGTSNHETLPEPPRSRSKTNQRTQHKRSGQSDRNLQLTVKVSLVSGRRIKTHLD